MNCQSPTTVLNNIFVPPTPVAKPSKKSNKSNTTMCGLGPLSVFLGVDFKRSHYKKNTKHETAFIEKDRQEKRSRISYQFKMPTGGELMTTELISCGISIEGMLLLIPLHSRSLQPPSAKCDHSTESFTASIVYLPYIIDSWVTIQSLKEVSLPVLHFTMHTSMERPSYCRKRLRRIHYYWSIAVSISLI